MRTLRAASRSNSNGLLRNLRRETGSKSRHWFGAVIKLTALVVIRIEILHSQFIDNKTEVTKLSENNVCQS